MARKAETTRRLERAVGPDQRGIPASDLDDDKVRKELRQLYRTREDTFFNGSAQALEEHTRRMLELEREYAARFSGETAPAPARTRSGARRRAGQDPNASGARRRPAAPSR